MAQSAIKPDDDDDSGSAVRIEMLDRLPPEFREPVYKHYAEELGVVERLMQLLGMKPETPIPGPEIVEIMGKLYGIDCNVRRALWEVKEAKRLIKWVKWQKKKKEQEEYNDRLLGKDWRERQRREIREREAKASGFKRRV
jgi:hypothetical protein